MPLKSMKSVGVLVLTAACLLTTLFTSVRADAQTFSVLYSFQNNGVDGQYPACRLVRDASGNLYGTTQYGGLYGYGTVFQIDSSGTESILYDFAADDAVSRPTSGILVLDESGNLYGMTSGLYSGTGGTAYKFNVYSRTFEILHSFSGADLSYVANLSRDRQGNLWGATPYGGTYNWGTVFKIDPAGNFTTLVSLPFSEGVPLGPPMPAAPGNVYVILALGGTYGRGAIARINLSGQVEILYSFTETTGSYPWLLTAGIIHDSSNNLYGAASDTGSRDHYAGTAWRFNVSTGTFTALHTFPKDASAGALPYGPLVPGKDRNLYGITQSGGAFCTTGSSSSECGFVYKIAPDKTFSIVHAFVNYGGIYEGYQPGPGVIFDPQGNLYGTAVLGGQSGVGTVYKITP